MWWSIRFHRLPQLPALKSISRLEQLVIKTFIILCLLWQDLASSLDDKVFLGVPLVVYLDKPRAPCPVAIPSAMRCVGVAMEPASNVTRLWSDGVHATWQVGTPGRVTWWDLDGVRGEQVGQVVAHLQALQAVAQGLGGAGGGRGKYGVVLEAPQGGQLELPQGGGPGWACRPDDSVAKAVAATPSDWQVIQLSYNLRKPRLVAELLAERLQQHGADLNGIRVRRKGSCDVWSLVQGTAAYAVSAEAASRILQATNIPPRAAIDGVFEWDLTSLLWLDVSWLLFSRLENVYMSTCPFFPPTSPDEGPRAQVLQHLHHLLNKANDGTDEGRFGPSSAREGPPVAPIAATQHEACEAVRTGGGSLSIKSHLVGTADFGFERVVKRTVPGDSRLNINISPSCDVKASRACRQLSELRQTQVFDVCDDSPSEGRDSHSLVIYDGHSFLKLAIGDGGPGNETGAQRAVSRLAEQLQMSQKTSTTLLKVAANLDAIIRRARTNELNRTPLSSLRAARDMAVFWHVGAAGFLWEAIVEEQMNELVRSGLVDALGRVRGVVVGERFVPKDPRFQLEQLGPGSASLYEFPTVDRLWRHCQLEEHADGVVFYLHTKGAYSGMKDPTELARSTDWRHYMTYFTITRFRECLAAMDQGYEVCGASSLELDNSDTKMMAGNFWWATCSYVRDLPPPLSLNTSDRYLAEYWLGMAKSKDWRPARCFQTLKFASVPYLERLKRADYEHDIGCGVYVPVGPQRTSIQ